MAALRRCTVRGTPNDKGDGSSRKGSHRVGSICCGAPLIVSNVHCVKSDYDLLCLLYMHLGQ